MNMKKLLAGVVGMTVLMSNVAFAAVSTTTTYNAGTGKVDVKTTVSELTNGSMVTYVLYGAKGSDEIPFNATTGEIVGTAEKAPEANEQKDNIIYIDQINNVTENRAEFTAPGLNVGEAYGAKVIVGTDKDADAGDVAVTEDYTGDMYTLKLAADAADYTAKVEVNMGENYIKVYSLRTAGSTVKVPVGANCKVTFAANDANNEIATSAVTSTDNNITNGNVSENDGVINFEPKNYAINTEYVLSATTREKVEAPVITVSEPITGTSNQVSYLVNVENFEAKDTGLKIEIIDWDNQETEKPVLHEFDNLTPHSVVEGMNCYAIRIVDETEGYKLKMPNVTNGYRVTPFIVVNRVNIYAGSTSAGETNHFTVGTDPTLSNGAVDSSETQPEGPNDEPTDESTDESTDEPAEEPVAEEPVVVEE